MSQEGRFGMPMPTTFINSIIRIYELSWCLYFLLGYVLTCSILEHGRIDRIIAKNKDIKITHIFGWWNWLPEFWSSSLAIRDTKKKPMKKVNINAIGRASRDICILDGYLLYKPVINKTNGQVNNPMQKMIKLVIIHDLRALYWVAQKYAVINLPLYFLLRFPS